MVTEIPEVTLLENILLANTIKLSVYHSSRHNEFKPMILKIW